MNIREKVRGALRRIAGVSLGDAIAAGAAGSSAFNEKRRTVALPSILNTYGFSRTGIAALNILPKPTPANLRRFAETPVARKAINTIKDRIAGMKWRVQARRGRSLAELPGAAAPGPGLPRTLDQPNPEHSIPSPASQAVGGAIWGGI